MTSITWLPLAVKIRSDLKNRLHDSSLWKTPSPPCGATFPHTRLKSLPLLCTKSFPWESSPSYAPIGEDDSIIKRSSVIEPINGEESSDLPFLQSENDVIEMRDQTPTLLPQQFKWPMWLLGPSVIVATGALPTLWLPLSSVFLGPNIAALLSLVGLDCIFNIGAILFLLMADACAHHKGSSSESESHVPLTYRAWNLGSSLMGLLAPLLMLFASYKGYLQPHLPFISFSVLLGPYLLLLSIQMLTEMLTWHWNSPVWLVTPVVYEAYRVLQLMRGLKLAGEVGAPAWAVDGLRGLVLWWVLVLGVQLMRVACFAGPTSPTQQQPQAQ